jgi:hypothetical protein
MLRWLPDFLPKVICRTGLFAKWGFRRRRTGARAYASKRHRMAHVPFLFMEADFLQA